MRKLLATSAALMTLAVPSVAEAQKVTGKLSHEEARTSVRRALPGQAPKLLLKDERASFYHTSSIRILASRRINRSEINVRYRLLMRPDKEHREANWFPIRCRGWVWIGKLNTGRLIGDIKRYKCWTVNP